MYMGPITLEAKVHFANDDEGMIGSATVGLPPGRPATVEALHIAVGQTLAALPDGCRLLEPSEFFNRVLVKEKTGRVGNFALPDEFQYDTTALTEAACAAYTPMPDEEGESGGIDDDESEEED